MDDRDVQERVGDVKVVECESCNQVTDCTFDSNPFAEEIRGDDTPHWLCDSCRRELARDI